MNSDDPDPQPTRTFPADPADASPGLTRTFSADPSSTASFSLSVPAPLTGPVPGWPAALTRYQPLHPLGDGGMGVVYLCHDLQLDRQVAVKLSGLGRPTPQDRVEFVLREARSAARLHHPNICPVFDSDVCDGVPYLTMAYVDGPTLAAELKRNGPCPPTAAAKLVRTVAEAMQYAHDTGVIHRDLKPSNILLTADHEPIVTDFGLAVRTDRDDAVGGISGTPHYMAPEQAAGDAANISERTDVFALGVILFQTLTGQVPFDGTAREVMTKVQREPLPPVRKFRKGVPKQLERIVAKATARKPADRYPTMTAFADALTGFLQTTKPKAGRGWKWAFWLGAMPAMAVLGVSALCCGMTILLPAIQKVRDAAERTKASADKTDRESKQKADAAYREGMELMSAGKDAEAVAKFDKAIRLDPPGKLSRTMRAVTLEKMKLYAEAIEDLDVLVKLEPNDPAHFRFRGSLRAKLKETWQHENAVNDFGSAINLQPGTAALYVQRAAVLLRLSRFKEAQSDCERAVGLDPKDASARYLRGVAKRKLNDERGASEDISVALKLDDKVEHKLRAQGLLE
jgi:tetratricopeptide (TPR) repeat protein